MTQITIGDDQVEVRVDGDEGRPVLLLSNSLGTDHSLWDPQMPVLLQHFRVVRYDTRGHGGSALGAGPVSIARLGRDALAILDALDIRRAHVLGLSMGGAVAQWLLLNAAERVDRVVLANSAAKFGVPETWNERIALVLADGMARVADETMPRWFGDGFREAAPDDVARIHGLMGAMAPAAYAACCAALRDMDLREAMRGIERSVLVVTGRDDPVVDDRDTAILLSGYNTRHVELDARHLSNIEAADAFNEAVVSFLTAKAPARRAATRPLAPRTKRKTAARSSAARNPLKDAKKAGKAAVKPAAPKLASSTKTPAARKATTTASSRRSLGAKPAAAPRPAAVKTSAAKARKAPATKPAKVVAKARAKPAVAVKTTRTGSTARRAGAAPKRGAIKTPTSKTATTKRTATKTAVKKVAPKKAAPKKAAAKKMVAKRAFAKTAATKTVVKKTTPASKASAARRKPPSKTRGASPRRRP